MMTKIMKREGCKFLRGFFFLVYDGMRRRKNRYIHRRFERLVISLGLNTIESIYVLGHLR